MIIQNKLNESSYTIDIDEKLIQKIYGEDTKVCDIDTTISIEKYIQYFDHDQEYDEFEPIELDKDAMMNEI